MLLSVFSYALLVFCMSMNYTFPLGTEFFAPGHLAFYDRVTLTGKATKSPIDGENDEETSDFSGSDLDDLGL